MNLNTSISASQLFGVWGTPREPYWIIKPFSFKINDIEPERRFVNLFGEFSPLHGIAFQYSVTMYVYHTYCVVCMLRLKNLRQKCLKLFYLPTRYILRHLLKAWLCYFFAWWNMNKTQRFNEIENSKKGAEPAFFHTLSGLHFSRHIEYSCKANFK